MMCAQVEVTAALPTSITLTADFLRSTWTMPSPMHARIRAKAKRVVHGGVIGTVVTTVATRSITCAELIGLGDDWAGRTVSIIADATDGSAAVWNFLCSVWTDGTGTFTIDATSPDPAALGVQADDVLLILCEPPGTCGTNSITDAGFVNGLSPTGLTVDAEIGYLVRIIAGIGRGQVRRIIDNDTTGYTIDEAWETLPDATSKFIVEVPGWEYFGESTVAPTPINTTEGRIRLVADNMLNQTMLVAAIGIDVNNVEAPEDLSPVRMIYMFGQTSPILNGGWMDYPGADTITIDLANGVNHSISLNRASTAMADPIYTGGSITAGAKANIRLVEDNPGNRVVVWGSAFLNLPQPTPDGDTWSKIPIIYNGVKWEQDVGLLFGVPIA
jgi:hypothetical protein